MGMIMADYITVITAVIMILISIGALKTFHERKNPDAFIWVLVALFWTITALSKSL